MLCEGPNSGQGVHLTQSYSRSGVPAKGLLRPQQLCQGMELACATRGRAGQGCQDLAGSSLFV